MLAFYGSRISNHMTETPEGFLICHDVPINRTGTQQYLAREIGLEGDKLVTVYRDEDEVFDKAAMASFEGKPVCQDHPPCAVEPYNFAMYTKGHAQNVHRGHGDEADETLADLFINDPDLIRAIKDGMREVSCGYECEYVPDETGRIHQCKIRGNHVAVVAAGRAGHRVSIKDSKPYYGKKERNDFMKTKKPSMFSRFFVGWAADKDPDEAAAALDELMEEKEPKENLDEDPMNPAPTQKPAVPAEKPTPDCGPAKDDANGEVVALLKQVLAKLENTAAGADADPIQNLVDELAAGQDPQQLPPPEDQEASVTVPAEEMQQNDEEAEQIPGADLPKNPIPGADSAATIAALKAMKPYIAKLPERERRAAADAATKAVRSAMGMNGKSTSDGYAAVQMVMRQNAMKNKPKVVDESQLGKNIMAKYNPHYKK